MSDCPPKYKNLNRIQSFSEDRNVTVQLMEQACQNDEYLKQLCEELEYLTPPAIRKRHSPILIDDSQSWGHQVNQNNTVTISNKTEDEVIIDFDDDTFIDTNKSDCDFENFATYDNDGNPTGDSRRAVVPIKTQTNINYNCKNWSAGDQINSFWYVGYDKTKNYQVRPDWLKDWRDLEIPCVSRAQTFKIPSGISNGLISSVDIYLENNGTQYSNWGSPLYVRLCPVRKTTVKKTKWDKTQKKSVPDIDLSTGKQKTETIYIPDTGPNGSNVTLATGTFQPQRCSPGNQNIKFDKKVKVNANERYALLFSSPLSHPNHCPRIGGWGRNCAVDKYADGDAFLSENNCRTWMRYGKNDDTVKTYKEGMYTPLDFAFKFHIITTSSGRDNTEDYYLYTKPIMMNPIKSVELSSVCYGDEDSATNVDLEFQISHDGRTWQTPNEAGKVFFSRDSTTNEYPHMCFVRAKMSTTSTSTTPYIENIHLDFEMEPASEMYARTYYERANTEPMLGATHWGRIYAPFKVDPTVTGGVEIIQDTTKSETFTIIEGEELERCTGLGLDDDKLTNESISVRYQYLVDNPSAIEVLRKEGIYVKPWTHTVDEESVTEPMSFSNGIQLVNSPAYPIIEVRSNPENGREQAYAEWIDFTFDYDNDFVIFYSDVLPDIPVGGLTIAYNPIFIQDLTNFEIGRRDDGEGLILDYFKEDFVVSESEVETRRLKLRVAPSDPIRQVIHNEEELREDIDYNVDYDSHEIIFPVSNIDGTGSRLNVNDNVTVVYTPYIPETGLALGYRAKRTNLDKQMTIENNYFEYKV